MLAIPVSACLGKELREKHIRELKSAGCDRVLLDSPTCEFFLEGDKRVSVLAELKEDVAAYKAAGFDVAIWTTTLGYGGERDPAVPRMFPNALHIRNASGVESTAICLLDQEFRSYICRNLQDFARCGVDTILLDDELVLSVRPGYTCACKEHLALLSNEVGMEVPIEEVKKVFVGSPTPLRKTWMQIQGRSMLDYCRYLRKAVDEVSPAIRIGLCASYTNYEDGYHVEEAVRILAGQGNKPLYRLSGAPYWAAFAHRTQHQNLQSVIEFMRWQHSILMDQGIELQDENDPFPRDPAKVPPAFVETYDKVSMLLPGMVRQKYIFYYGDETVDRKPTLYYEQHMKNLPNDAKLIKMFEGTTPIGFRVREFRNKFIQAHLSDDFTGYDQIMANVSQNHAGAFLSSNGIPVTYEGDGPIALFGEAARQIDLRELAKGALIDVRAANILRERGVDVGLKNATFIHPDKLICKGQIAPCKDESGAYSLLVEDGASVLAYYMQREDQNPAVSIYENKKKQRFVILGIDCYASVFTHGFGCAISSAMQQATADGYKFLAGTELPAMLSGETNCYLYAAKDDKKLCLLICNPTDNDLLHLSLPIDGGKRILSSLHSECEIRDGSLIIPFLPAGGYAAVAICY